MRLPPQAPPVPRRTLPHGGPPAGSGIAASNFQCWTENDCDGLAFAYGVDLADCCTQGARSGRGINLDQGRGCLNCPPAV